MATRKKVSLDPDFKEFIALLNSEGVRYLLLGGYAVNFHGYHRFTGDIDFWIAIDWDNAGRVSKVLQRFGFSAATVSPEQFTEPGKVHMFGNKLVRVDLLTGPSGVEFEESYGRRVVDTFDGVDGNQHPRLSMGRRPRTARHGTGRTHRSVAWRSTENSGRSTFRTSR